MDSERAWEMTSMKQESAVEACAAPEKSVWKRPEFAKLEVGEAEAQDGTGTDASGFLS